MRSTCCLLYRLRQSLANIFSPRPMVFPAPHTGASPQQPSSGDARTPAARTAYATTLPSALRPVTSAALALRTIGRCDLGGGAETTSQFGVDQPRAATIRTGARLGRFQRDRLLARARRYHRMHQQQPPAQRQPFSPLGVGQHVARKGNSVLFPIIHGGPFSALLGILAAKLGRTVYHLSRRQRAFDAKKFLTWQASRGSRFPRTTAWPSSADSRSRRF
jgi:hypothetical protein